MILIILKSLLLGFVITLPVGPSGILCLRQVLQLGALKGFIFGLSQALALSIFSVVVVFGIGSVSDFMSKYQCWLLLVGGVVLIGFGVKIWVSKSSAITNKEDSKKGVIADFFSITFFMLISPNTWIPFLIFSALLKLYVVTTLVERIEVVLGILIGSIVSWMVVCLCFAGYKKTASRSVMTWINRSVGVCVVVCGIALCASAFLPFCL